MGKYFGTDGFRGEANVNLTAEHAYQIGRFLGWYYGELKKQKQLDEPAKIVIGKDTRRSSYMFEYSLVSGLTASGADAYLLHVTTTPSVAYVARTDDFDCGIMISASHNPYYDNGIKLINSNGEKMDEETILLVEDYIDGKLRLFGQEWKELPYAHKDAIGCTVDYVAGRNRYMGYLISLGVYSFKGMKVGLDCANGSSWNMAKSIFEALGAKCYVINNEPNGLNINNNAGSTHIEGLQKYVVDNGLDVGFAYDGDADRCLCVDELGNVITGDHILYIYGKYMKERGKLDNNLPALSPQCPAVRQPQYHFLHPRPQRCRRRSGCGSAAAYPGAYQSRPCVPRERCHSKTAAGTRAGRSGKSPPHKQGGSSEPPAPYQHPARRSMRRSGTLKVVSLVEPPFLFWFREKQEFAQPLRPFPREGERLWRIYIPVA